MYPPAPSIVRIAKLTDIPRIGVVAAAGFFHSAVFKFERPHYAQYPHDTVADYKASFQEAILDPNQIVLVAEDDLNINEEKDVYEALRKVYPPFDEQMPPEILKSRRSIVAVMSLSFDPNTQRKGQFLPEGENPNVPDDSHQTRDQDPTGLKHYADACKAKKAKYFKGKMIFDMLVTHPTYWRRGHGTALTKWAVDIADLDNVAMGGSATIMGRKLFEPVGFKEMEAVEVKGYASHPDSIIVWLGVRPAKGAGGAVL